MKNIILSAIMLCFPLVSFASGESNQRDYTCDLTAFHMQGGKVTDVIGVQKQVAHVFEQSGVMDGRKYKTFMMQVNGNVINSSYLFEYENDGYSGDTGIGHFQIAKGVYVITQNGYLYLAASNCVAGYQRPVVSHY